MKTFLPQRTQKIVRISEKLELWDGFCKDVIANAQRTKKFFELVKVRHIRSSINDYSL